MIAFLRNNYYRIKSRKHYVFIAIIMTIFSIAAAIFMTSKAENKMNLAVVTQQRTVKIQSKYVNFSIMKQKPDKYQLVLGRYDGIIVYRGNGKYDFETIKGRKYRNMMEVAVQDPGSFVPKTNSKREVGSNIIGYVMMFLLMQSVLFMFMLSEDIEFGYIKRIVAAPVSFFKYLAAIFISVFLMVFIPAICTIILMKAVFGFNIGFSLAEYAVLFLMICFMGIAFSMFITSVIKNSDTSNILGNSIIVLTTILAGSFYSFEKGNKLLQKILWIIPQKDYLSFVQGIENGKTFYDMFPQLSYVIVLSIILFIFSIMKIKNDYVLKKS